MQILEEIKISDNGFVFNAHTGESFSLNSIGLEIIKMIEINCSFDKIRNTVLEKYDVDGLTFEKDFNEFSTMLKHYQLTQQNNPLDFI